VSSTSARGIRITLRRGSGTTASSIPSTLEEFSPCVWRLFETHRSKKPASVCSGCKGNADAIVARVPTCHADCVEIGIGASAVRIAAKARRSAGRRSLERSRMIKSLLVANRGEIACRIFRTARRLGVRTIAVYSDADAGARHVREADEAFRIGPAAARESYLSIERILEAARLAGAEAIHPGYGFLSENAKFAQACVDAGVLFVGPPAAAIAAMGSKIVAKARMRA